MALYEVVFITRQDLSVEDVDGLSDKLTKIVTDHKGKLISKEYWGLRTLAYKVNKNSRGHYVLLNFDVSFDAIAEVKRVSGFDENIVRSNIFRVEEHNKSSQLMVSVDAKSFKAGKVVVYKPSEFDVAIDQIVINNL